MTDPERKAADHTGAPSSAAAAPLSGPSATDAAPAEPSPHAGEGAEPYAPAPKKGLLARLLGR